MKQSYYWSPEADASFLEYLEHLRKQPLRPGFPRKTLAELAQEQGVKPINKEELLEVVRRYGLADGD